MKTETIKNIFKKLINEIRKYSEKEEIEIKNRIIDVIYKNYESDVGHINLIADLQEIYKKQVNKT